MAACAPVDGVVFGPRRPSSTPITTPTSTIEVSLQVGCTLDPDNSLRAVCEVYVEPPVEVHIRFSKSDGSGRERVHSLQPGHAEIGLYMMAADTEYTWEAMAPVDPSATVSGVITTGSLPVGAAVDAVYSGTSSADYFLFGTPCVAAGFGIVMTPEGEVVWYQPLSPAQGGQISGVSWTEDNTVLGLFREGVTEVDWMGNELFQVVKGVDFTEEIHHDLFKRNGHIYVLFQESAFLFGGEFLMDGLHVFGQDGAKVAEWHLQDVFEPPEGPQRAGLVDYSHSNAVFVGGDGDILVSMRHLSAVAKLNGDFGDPNFGEVLWRLSGDASNEEFGMDFTLDGPPGVDSSFAMQHNVHWLDDGRLAMFDNRAINFEDSRVLVMDVDELAKEVAVDDVYELGRHCRFQGGAWHTAAGNPVATCAPQSLAFEYEPGVYQDPVYDVNVSCADGMSTYIPRFTPVVPR